MTSLVIPAYNEREGIARLLGQLIPDPSAGTELEIIVVCNGCTDDTAEVAAGFLGVRVITTPQAGKAAAMRLGDAAATSFPRVYIDSDVEIGRGDIVALCRALEDPGVLVAAPRRRIPRHETTRLVSMYYDVWEELPHVRAGVFGRGVIALTASGFERTAALPQVMADDLAVSAMFTDSERRVVDSAEVVIHPPRTWSGLLHRRTRIVTGTHQLYETGNHRTVTDSRTSISDLLDVLRRRPTKVLALAVFCYAALAGRARATRLVSRDDYTTWLRDESSRSS